MQNRFWRRGEGLLDEHYGMCMCADECNLELGFTELNCSMRIHPELNYFLPFAGLGRKIS